MYPYLLSYSKRSGMMAIANSTSLIGSIVPFSLAARLCTYIYMFSVGLELGSPKNANIEDPYVIFGKVCQLFTEQNLIRLYFHKTLCGKCIE